MTDFKNNKRPAWLYFQVIFATVVWGGAYPFTKYLITEISPLSIITFRALVGTLVLIFLSGSRLKISDFRPAIMWKILALSLLGVSAQQYLQAYALKYTLASHAGWLIAVTPIMVAGLMAVLGEKIGPFRLAAFVAGFAGTLLVVVSRSGAGAFALPSTRGDLIFLFTCAIWTVYVTLTKKWLTSWPQARVTTLTMLTALITVLPLWLLAGGPAEFVSVTPRGWLSLAYLSLLSSALAYLFWNNSVEGLGPVKSSYFIYLEPFSTAVSAYFLLGEVAGAPAFAGGLLILAGVYLLGLKESYLKPLKEAARHV